MNLINIRLLIFEIFKHYNSILKNKILVIQNYYYLDDFYQ